MTRYLISFDACKLQSYPHSPGAGGAEVGVELRPADDEDYADEEDEDHDDDDDDDYEDYDDDDDDGDEQTLRGRMKR